MSISNNLKNKKIKVVVNYKKKKIKILLFFIYFSGDNMFLIAHRANDNHHFSENSKEAIKYCLNQEYIDGVEIDVRITKDKQLVLIHNPTIDFISNGHGIVKYMTLEELRKYRYGKANASITTLEEVLKIFNDKILLIELKEIGNDYITLIETAVELINKYPYLNIYVSSFNFELLSYLKANYPHIKCGLIIGYGLNLLKVNNNFDFYVIQYHLLELLEHKKETFIFSMPKSDIDKIDHNSKVITDTCYKIENLN